MIEEEETSCGKPPSISSLPRMIECTLSASRYEWQVLLGSFMKPTLGQYVLYRHSSTDVTARMQETYVVIQGF